jgi:peptide/nickel transport system permease protein
MSEPVFAGPGIQRAESPGLWVLAWRRFRHDRVGVIALAVALLFFVLMLAASLHLVAGDWAQEVGINYAPPTFVGPDSAEAPVATLPAAADAERGERAATSDIVDPLAGELAEIRRDPAVAEPVAAKAPTLAFGGDKWGRDVLKKVIKGTQTSLFVGLAAALLATFLGTVFGALAGYYGRALDDFFNWFYSIFTSVPYLLLILAIAAVLNQKGTLTVVLILGLTGWPGIFRLVRAEYLKHKSREYIQAADAIGASHRRRMFVHILPNVSHVILVQLSLHVVLFIKSEVILSFLGFGVGVDTVSWGSMLNEAQSELILGKWWQLAAATLAMATLVTAFSLFTDALRDALDPRLK